LGPHRSLFAYSDTWQLVINIATTIVTFLIMFMIQNTQNRDTATMHLKLDELIRVTQKACNAALNREEPTTASSRSSGTISSGSRANGRTFAGMGAKVYERGG
jgi:low affinity Fe/Cu permease